MVEKIKDAESLFQTSGLTCTWNTIKVGWDLGLLMMLAIEKFTQNFLEAHPNLINKYCSELLLGIDDHEVSMLLKKLFISLNLEYSEVDSPLWNKEWRRWRYCLLHKMIESIQDKEKLLMAVEGVYADFGYPEDMVPFIYYMPADKKSESLTIDEARSELIKKLKQFLEEEIKHIESGCDWLPRRMY